MQKQGFQSNSDQQRQIKRRPPQTQLAVISPCKINVNKPRRQRLRPSNIPHLIIDNIQQKEKEPFFQFKKKQILQQKQQKKLIKSTKLLSFFDQRLNQLFQSYDKQQQCYQSVPIGSMLQIKRIINGEFKQLKQTTNEIAFDQNFESGNLLKVFKVNKYQFDIYMRVDSNSRGHSNWFYFKVLGLRKGMKVRFNVCNFLKTNLLFRRPAVRKGKLDWTQGVDITQCKYNLYKRIKNKNYYRLSFLFKCPEDSSYQFAAYPPYTYSDLCQEISFLKKYKSVSHTELAQSLGNVSIPLLTIGKSVKPAWVVLVLARQHPGETMGSFVLSGFMKQVIQQNKQSIVFKIVPMMNPDGVIMGNFRNSFAGTDLNRTFDCQRKLVYPQSQAVSKLAKSLKSQYGQKFLVFLDFHGHSIRKNAFTFGPPHKEKQKQQLSTVFNKLLSNKTSYFRYNSCNFNLSISKKTTARAFMFYKLKVPFTYTIQTSFGLWSKGFLTVKEFRQIGKMAAQSLFELIRQVSIPSSRQLLMIVDSNQRSESDDYNSSGGDSQSSCEDISQLSELLQSIELKKKNFIFSKKRQIRSYPLDQQIKTIQFPTIRRKDQSNLGQIIIKRPQLFKERIYNNQFAIHSERKRYSKKRITKSIQVQRDKLIKYVPIIRRSHKSPGRGKQVEDYVLRMQQNSESVFEVPFSIGLRKELPW